MAESGWIEHETDYVLGTHFKVELNLIQTRFWRLNGFQRRFKNFL